VTLRFPYQPESLGVPPPPTLPPGAKDRWRPLIPVRLLGPTGLWWDFEQALLDPGADDTVFPIDFAAVLEVKLRPATKHGLRWRGQRYGLRFGGVSLQIGNAHTTWRWPALVAFSQAPLRYPILGNCGCLQFFNANFLGEDLEVELEKNGCIQDRPDGLRCEIGQNYPRRNTKKHEGRV